LLLPISCSATQAASDSASEQATQSDDMIQGMLGAFFHTVGPAQYSRVVKLFRLYLEQQQQQQQTTGPSDAVYLGIEELQQLLQNALVTDETLQAQQQHQHQQHTDNGAAAAAAVGEGAGVLAALSEQQPQHPRWKSHSSYEMEEMAAVPDPEAAAAVASAAGDGDRLPGEGAADGSEVTRLVNLDTYHASHDGYRWIK